MFRRMCTKSVVSRANVLTALLAIALLAACSDDARTNDAASGTAAPSTRAQTTTASTVRATTTTATTTTTVPLRTCNRPHAAGQSAKSFTFQGQERTFQLYVPAAYDGTTAVPLVFNFHGYGSRASQQMLYGNFQPIADRENFLIVAPDGQGTVARHFNIGIEPALQNDVDMAGALLDHLEATLCIDPTRVYSTGMSNGGAMTTALACRMPDRFAAFAAVTVTFYREGCGGSRPVSIIAFAGTADPIVPFEGGKVNCCGGATIAAAADSMAGWARHNGCAAPTETRIGSEVRRRSWPRCADGADVAFYVVDGGGHTWPGAIAVPRLGHTTTQLDASATIWEFFAGKQL
jgi:polyhydroxybutyrate depolymerase